MFRKAERKQAKLRLALVGPSGSGKTYSALRIAYGLAGDDDIAMIDTENGSGELYAGMDGIPEYDVMTMQAPYSPEKYIEAIKAAEEGGYAVLIIDSLSHAWSGQGGLLEEKDRVEKAQKGGNSWTAWRDVTPKHNALVEAILQSNIHIITTMRAKTAYEVVDDGNGRKKPQKIGLSPVQRDGMEYEFTLVMDISTEGHYATASKDRTSMFDGHHFQLSSEHGEQLRDWLETGVDPDAERQAKEADLLAKVSEIDGLESLRDFYEQTKQKLQAEGDRKTWNTLKPAIEQRKGELQPASEEA